MVAVLGALLPVLLPVSAQSAGPEDRGYVKYYEVGSGETLDGIAERLLGSPERAGELLALNQGRVQPDGERLIDPLALNPGWLLILPWDAAGDGVHYGLLPTSTTHEHVAPPDDGCLADGATGSGAANGPPDDWAGRTLSVPEAWRTTRGGGVMVGVIDSGVDSSVAELAGRVLPGADITRGTSNGDTDCHGSGTAIASLIAARPVEGRPLTGLAPEATILPMRVTDGATAEADEAATAIEVAVSAGARVIVVGPTVPVDATPVVDAITVATAHDVVVVVAAGPAATDEPDTAQLAGAKIAARPGLLRAAAVDQAGGPAVPLSPDAADLVAPGVAVAALTPNGSIVPFTGASYAAAFVAGTAALVRAAAPSLTAAQVTELVLATAAASGPWRHLDPPAAVAAAAERSQPAIGPGPASDRDDLMSLVWAGLLVIVAVVVGFLVARRTSRRRQDQLMSYLDELPTAALTMDSRVKIGVEAELPARSTRGHALQESTTTTIGQHPASPAESRETQPDRAPAAAAVKNAIPAQPQASLRRPGAP